MWIAAHCFAEKRHLCFTHQCEFMVPAALMAHHTETLTSCNGTSLINIVFFAIPIILRVQMYSEMKTGITTKQKSGGSTSPANGVIHKIQFCFSTWFTNFWTSVVTLMKTKQFCCTLCWWCRHANLHTKQVEPVFFFEMSPIWHQFHPVLPQLVHVFYIFSYCPKLSKWNPLLETLFSSVFNCCAFGRGTSGNFCLNLLWHVLKHCEAPISSA